MSLIMLLNFTTKRIAKNLIFQNFGFLKPLPLVFSLTVTKTSEESNKSNKESNTSTEFRLPSSIRQTAGMNSREPHSRHVLMQKQLLAE